jgi:non-ribosomal peptide synthetase component E (peptide arylation enzyme)
MNRLDDPEEKIYTTDGSPLPGMEVKVVDSSGNKLPPGEEGDLLSRGSFTFLGYYKRPKFTAETFVDGEWMATGDRAKMDADGYISITGRTKDIIIRGGENISVAEVENLLHMHPKIANVSVVGMPDTRLQERACAYVILKPGVTSLTLAEVTTFLGEHKLAKQKYPERLEIVSAFPMTASGKIQKFRLREDIRQKLSTEN